MGNLNPDEIIEVAKRADCLHSEAEVEEAITVLAKKISLRLAHKNPIILCVMNGGLVLSGKLVTQLNFPLQIDYLHATRYRGNTSGAELQWKQEPTLSMKDRTVLVVDDIYDEGVTLDIILSYCREQGAANVYSAVLVDKIHDRKCTNLSCDFVGLKVEDRYLFGYGMDYKGYLRNAPGIFAIAEVDM